ncbi:MAG TPA: VOC family protein [Caulobacteraceae bacterium]|nr:VOC family protein [Caulobacteraceae bacterium]
MPQLLALTTIVVRDYDEAVAFYRDKIGFELVEDTPLGAGKRWVVVRPRGAAGGVLLAQGVGQRQTARIGDQTGGRVGFFLHTDDFERDYAAMTARGVRFVREPRREPYGVVAVWEDLYGNLWDLLQPA